MRSWPLIITRLWTQVVRVFSEATTANQKNIHHTTDHTIIQPPPSLSFSPVSCRITLFGGQTLNMAAAGLYGSLELRNWMKPYRSETCGGARRVPESRPKHQRGSRFDVAPVIGSMSDLSINHQKCFKSVPIFQ